MTHMGHGLLPIEPDYKAERDRLAEQVVFLTDKYCVIFATHPCYRLAQRILKEIEDEPR